MQKLWKILGASIVVAMCALPAQAASHLDSPIDPAVIVKAGGFEWVWAAPCAALGESCGVPVLRDNFVFPTEAQWLSSFSSTAALVAAFNNNGVMICAAPWFSTVHNHCDSEDLIGGFVWHAPAPIGNLRNNDPAAETFLVRAVPEPTTYAMLALGLGLIGLIARKRST
jgi:hypothetical protein